MHSTSVFVWLLPIAGCLLLASCSAKGSRTVTLATTTSTQDSGLLDVLVPMFRAETGIDVKVVAVGTGQALQLGQRGDADVLLVHDPAAEEKFMADGFGALRRYSPEGLWISSFARQAVSLCRLLSA